MMTLAPLIHAIIRDGDVRALAETLGCSICAAIRMMEEENDGEHTRLPAGETGDGRGE